MSLPSYQTPFCCERPGTKATNWGPRVKENCMQIPSSWRVCRASIHLLLAPLERVLEPKRQSERVPSPERRLRRPKLRWRRVWDTNCDGKCTSNFNLWAYGVTDSRQLLRPALPSTGPTVDSFKAGFASLTFQVSICSHGAGPCVHSSSLRLKPNSAIVLTSCRINHTPHGGFAQILSWPGLLRSQLLPRSQLAPPPPPRLAL